MEQAIKQVEHLIEKAGTCGEAGQAKDYAQAAVSASQAAVHLAGLKAHLAATVAAVPAK